MQGLELIFFVCHGYQLLDFFNIKDSATNGGNFDFGAYAAIFAIVPSRLTHRLLLCLTGSFPGFFKTNFGAA